MAFVLKIDLLMAVLVGAKVSCGGVDRDSCYNCPPMDLAAGEKLDYYCGGECMVDPSGHFCVLNTANKERHLAFAEGLLSDYEKLTRKTLYKLHHTAEGEKKPTALLADMNTALTAARIMQSSLRESLEKTTDITRRVSCGGHDASSCEECMGPNEQDKGKCNGDCMHDGNICMLKPKAPSFTFGGDKLKIPDSEAYAFLGIQQQKVSCGGETHDRCELCDSTKPGQGASVCHGDCYYSKGGVCIPKFETMKRHTREAEDTLKTLLQYVEHGYHVLKDDTEKVDVSDPALGLQKQYPDGGIMDLHKETDRDLDVVQGIVPQIAKLLRRSEVQLEQASPKVSCGGKDADSCAECMPTPGSGHDMDASYCNGDCHFHMGECIHMRPASILEESDMAAVDDKKQVANAKEEAQAAKAKGHGVRQLRIEDIAPPKREEPSSD